MYKVRLGKGLEGLGRPKVCLGKGGSDRSASWQARVATDLPLSKSGSSLPLGRSSSDRSASRQAGLIVKEAFAPLCGGLPWSFKVPMGIIVTAQVMKHSMLHSEIWLKGSLLVVTPNEL